MAKENPAGFAISTYPEHLVEENARDSFENHPKFRKEVLKAGLMNNKGEITHAGWIQLNKDWIQLEHNSLKWLRKNFESATDEGHDKNDDLVGTFYYDPSNERQRELIETALRDRIDMIDASYGDLANSVWDGVSQFGSVLGGQIDFMDVNWPNVEKLPRD